MTKKNLIKKSDNEIGKFYRKKSTYRWTRQKNSCSKMWLKYRSIVYRTGALDMKNNWYLLQRNNLFWISATLKSNLGKRIKEFSGCMQLCISSLLSFFCIVLSCQNEYFMFNYSQYNRPVHLKTGKELIQCIP